MTVISRKFAAILCALASFGTLLTGMYKENWFIIVIGMVLILITPPKWDIAILWKEHNGPRDNS